jgi:hypothetical protein
MTTISFIVSIGAYFICWRYSMDSVPTELLELQARFAHWRSTRKYVRESIPDELRSAALEMTKHYPPSLIHRVLKLDPSRLKNKAAAKRSTRTAMTKKKLAARPSTRTSVTKFPPPAFFKLPTTAALPLDSSPPQTPPPCRLQLERPDGSRLILILPALDGSAIKLLCADFLRG